MLINKPSRVASGCNNDEDDEKKREAVFRQFTSDPNNCLWGKAKVTAEPRKSGNGKSG